MRDYWDAVRKPASALNSYRKHDLRRTLKLLITSAFFFSLGASLLVSKIAFLAGAFSPGIFAGFLLAVFALVILVSLGLGLVHEMISGIMGGRGKYYESLTAISFFWAAPSVGLFITSLLLFVPYVGIILGSFIVALTFSTGLASLYRSTKELAKVDTLTSYIIVSILMLSFFVMFYSMIVFNFASLLGG
ncbi:MAG: hypothetical protein HYW26_02955 [Candidatus Aenigmarchaeota archaeon]|nr:hypothetical protein [Candidatus Aenigmarchaeota archaeon]